MRSTVREAATRRWHAVDLGSVATAGYEAGCKLTVVLRRRVPAAAHCKHGEHDAGDGDEAEVEKGEGGQGIHPAVDGEGHAPNARRGAPQRLRLVSCRHKAKKRDWDWHEQTTDEAGELERLEHQPLAVGRLDEEQREEGRRQRAQPLRRCAIWARHEQKVAHANVNLLRGGYACSGRIVLRELSLHGNLHSDARAKEPPIVRISQLELPCLSNAVFSQHLEQRCGRLRHACTRSRCFDDLCDRPRIALGGQALQVQLGSAARVHAGRRHARHLPAPSGGTCAADLSWNLVDAPSALRNVDGAARGAHNHLPFQEREKCKSGDAILLLAHPRPKRRLCIGDRDPLVCRE